MRPHRAIASFDSASTMLRVLAQHLHGRSSPALGLGPTARLAARALPLVNRFPAREREWLYAHTGGREALRPSRLPQVDTDAVAAWAAAHYPRRSYPAVLIGSSSGAAIHLAALAGIPWLPQTFLVPVRHHGLDPDDPTAAMAELAPAREAFLDANPGIALHQMHDPNQDRLMIRHMAYFRYKYRKLPPAYADFLSRNLEPGGTVLVLDCTETFPATTTGDRQYFQHGAIGGATAEEYEHGGPRVHEFLTAQGSSVDSWPWPETDTHPAEAEWGFDRALLTDLSALCGEHDLALRRVTYPHAQSLSAPVADLHRAWYGSLGLPADRLLVDCFALLDAHLPLRKSLVPYWTVFSTQPAAAALVDYLDHTRRYDEIHIGLFSHGTRSIGLAALRDWDRALGRAAVRGEYCGVDRKVYPQDFASNGRFHSCVAELDGSPAPEAGWGWVRDWLNQHALSGV